MGNVAAGMVMSLSEPFASFMGTHQTRNQIVFSSGLERIDKLINGFMADRTPRMILGYATSNDFRRPALAQFGYHILVYHRLSQTIALTCSASAFLCTGVRLVRHVNVKDGRLVASQFTGKRAFVPVHDSGDFAQR